MQSDDIRAAILADPQLRQWVQDGNDQSVAEAISAIAPRVPTGELYTERAVFAELGPVMAESVFSKLEAFAAAGHSGSSLIARGLRWLQPSNGGMDFQNPDVQQLLQGLQVAGVIAASESAALQSLGLQPDVVTHADVGEAVRLWRVNGSTQLPGEED